MAGVSDDEMSFICSCRNKKYINTSVSACQCLGPVLASHALSPSAAASAACQGWGRVPIAGWSYDRVGPERGLRGGGRRG